MHPTLPQTISATRMMLTHGRGIGPEKRAEMEAFIERAEAVLAQRPESWFRREMARLKLLADGVRA